MDTFRTIAIDVFLGLGLVLAIIVIVKASRQVAAQSWEEMNRWWKHRKLTAQTNTINEFLTGLPTADLGRIALECWHRELSGFHERAIRYRFKDYGEEAVQKELEEALKQQEGILKESEAAMEKMTRQELLSVIHQYVKDWTEQNVDPERRLKEVVNSCSLNGWKGTTKLV